MTFPSVANEMKKEAERRMKATNAKEEENKTSSDSSDTSESESLIQHENNNLLEEFPSSPSKKGRSPSMFKPRGSYRSLTSRKSFLQTNAISLRQGPQQPLKSSNMSSFMANKFLPKGQPSLLTLNFPHLDPNPPQKLNDSTLSKHNKEEENKTLQNSPTYSLSPGNFHMMEGHGGGKDDRNNVLFELNKNGHGNGGEGNIGLMRKSVTIQHKHLNHLSFIPRKSILFAQHKQEMESIVSHNPYEPLSPHLKKPLNDSMRESMEWENLMFGDKDLLGQNIIMEENDEERKVTLKTRMKMKGKHQRRLSRLTLGKQLTLSQTAGLELQWTIQFQKTKL